MQYSITQMQQVNESRLRIDAEYWHPEFVANSHLVSSPEKIGDFVTSGVPNIKSTPIKRDFKYLEISQIAIHDCTYHTIPGPTR